MATQNMKGTFNPVETNEIFDLVRGHSTIAKICAQSPIEFTGNTVFTFDMDQEAQIVGESAKKAAGGITVAPKKIVPVKIEYGARVSEEFMYASEERALDITAAFREGFAKKAARALDIMSMHGLDPRSKKASSLIPNENSFDKNTGVAAITHQAGKEEEELESALAAIGDYDNTGYAISKVFAAALGKAKANGVHTFPEFKLGGKPEYLNGVTCDVNSTVSFAAEDGDVDQAIVGDFQNAFKWGVAKEIPYTIIPYGDPDNSGVDLAGSNQVYLRGEMYLGWAILAPSAFARIK